jgi:hypothetical protein
MNERFRELAEQAGSTHKQNLGVYQFYTDELEKFAELIIAECAQACINMGNEYEIKSAGQYQAELFAFAIKQHFGVEE